ncbi:MAG: type IX secretion system sortase PorU [Muribaculaceae bacterium]|nr:type IX secretion system sortase PorU [Muribaculaceae bacterium]
MSYHKSIITISLLTILSVVTALNAFSMNWKENSVLGSGKWAKVEVTENGIQEISYDTLRELGFDHPESVTLFGYPSLTLNHHIFNPAEPDDLPAVPIVHDNGRILFYGLTHEMAALDRQSKVELRRNHYSLSSFYYLTDSQPSNNLESISYNREIDCDTISTHTAFNYVNALDCNPSRAGVYFFSKNIATDASAGRLTIPTPGRVPDTSAACNGTILTDETQSYTLSVNGTKKQSQTSFGESYVFTSFPLFSAPYSADFKEQTEIAITPTASSSYFGFDYIGVTYTRSNRIDNLSELQLTFNSTSTYTRVLFPGSSPDNLWVWDVTNPIAPKSFELDADATVISGEPAESGTLLFLKGRCSPSVPSTHRRIIAFRKDATHHIPAVCPMKNNQNLHALDTPDMLIITTDECQAQAERLANLHRIHQGFTVHVVRHQDIFNEFSSGAPTPVAYRRMAKMFYDRDNLKFRYLLLFGASVFDNRRLLPHHSSYTPDKVLVCYQTDEPKLQVEDGTSFTTDSYFGLLDDNATGEIVNTYETEGYHKMLISVGRIPALNAEDARFYVDKAEAYLNNGISAAAQTRALIFADDGNQDQHLISAEAVAARLKRDMPYTVISRAHNGMYPWNKGEGIEARRKITSTLEKGVGIFIYTGHGRPDCFTSESLWTRYYVSHTHNTQYPLTIFASCNAFSFDRQENSISEATLFTENGGSVAVISATREVLNNENREFTEIILNHLANADENETFGDIFRKARNQNFYNKNYLAARANTNAYNFGGDPALPAYRPSRRVNLLKINDILVADESAVLNPMNANNISGNITDKDGKICDDYNGTLTVAIYESQRKVPNLYSDKASAAERVIKEMSVDDDLLCTITLPVVNGEFKGEIIPPAPTRPDEPARMILSAESPDGNHLNALGTVNGVTFGESKEHQIDPEPPVITDLYLDSPTFTDGSLTGSAPVLHARILSPHTSSLIGSSTIGSPIKITVDDIIDIKNPSISTDPSGTVLDVTATLKNLSEGSHFLTLSVSDIFGNLTSGTIHFQTVNSENEISIFADRPITSDEVEILADHNFPDDFTARIIIENSNGKHIRSVNNVVFPYKWDTMDNKGNPVPDGTYTIRVMAANATGYCGSGPLRITVLR